MAPRRRTIVLATAAVLLILLAAVVGAVVVLTQTDRGRAAILRAVLPVARTAIPGRLYVGKIGGTLFTDITIDSVDIKTPDGTPFISTGQVRLVYDPRDLLDFRVIVKSLEVDHPRVTLVDYGNDDWNWRRALQRRTARPSLRPGGRFGRYIIIDTTSLSEVSLELRLPWELSDTLHGVARDSALQYNLTRMDSEIRAEDGRHVRVYRFVRGNVSLGHSRLADPDSVGKRFALRHMDVMWDYPPFWFREVTGDVRILGDTLWVDSARLALPGSRAHGEARVEWGSDLPVRYDIALQLDTISMTDIAWIDETIPHSGGGHGYLRMKNDPRDLSIIEYAIRGMDASALKSRIRGDMTWGVGGPVVRLTDVNLDMQPAHTDLLRWMNGKPFPYDWRGELRGQIRASGGYVNNWKLESARLRFSDEHVRGSISSAHASGALNIYSPANALLKGVDLTIDTLDFRTPRFVNPLFMKLNGFARGKVRLDSLWYAAVFSNADIELVDGPGQPSRFTGNGRYALIPEGTWFDVDLQALPLSYTTLSQSYPALPLRGDAVGRIVARGMAERFDVQTTLAGEGGELAFVGAADALEPTMGAFGSWRVRGADLQSLFGDGRLPATSLSLNGTVNVEGEVISTLRGPLTATLDQFSRVANARVFGGTAAFRFDSGHVFIDTLAIESSALRLAAHGGLGLEKSKRDSLFLSVHIDSLGGLRPWLSPESSAASQSLPQSLSRSFILPTDSLKGIAQIQGSIFGSVDSLDKAGLDVGLRANLQDMVVAASRAARVDAEIQVSDVLRAASGWMTASGDSMFLMGIDVSSMSGRTTLKSGLAERFALAMRTPNESRVTVGGGVIRSGDSTALKIDTLSIRVDSGFTRPRGFNLAAPSVVSFVSGGIGRLDSLVLVHTDTGRVLLRGSVEAGDTVSGLMEVESVPLADIGRLMRQSAFVGGTIDAHALLSGTRVLPVLDGFAHLVNARSGRIRLGDLNVDAHYDSTRLILDGKLRADTVTAVRGHAVLPLDLALVTGRQRKLDLPLQGEIVTERTNLSVLESLLPDVTHAAGSVETRVQLTGSWDRPRLRGQMQVADGSLTLENLGIRINEANADIGLAGDSILIRRFDARSGVAGDSIGISGFVGITEISNPTFSLRLSANNFLAIDKARTASLTVSTPTPLTLTGSGNAPLVRGALRIDRGRVYISQLAQRKALDLSDSYDLIDTARVAVNSLLPSAPSALMQNLQLEDVRLGIGDDVWLRSPEANLKLGGQLRVTRSTSLTGGGVRLALADSLTVERGTYQLNLGIARPGFEVERGVVRFFGDPDLEPSLDITALHVVRETRANSNRQDVRIRVNIGGTLDQPTLTLTSADNPPLPESDMLSYLVTGEPAYALLGTPYAEQGATLALRLAGSYLSSRLAGGRFDVVQVEPTALAPGEAANLRDNGLGILASTRVGVGGQVARNTYLTFSTGLCGLAPQEGAGDALSLFAQGLGIKVERRFERGLSVAVGLEPGSSAQACGRLGISRTFQQTPPQLGIDFFRYWTFK